MQRSLYLLFFGLVPSVAGAGAIADTESVVQVTATRTPLTVAEATAPVIVIERDDILRNATFDLAEVLRFHAGIEIGRTGGPGQTTSLFIRGTNSNHTQVLVDGVRINPGTLGGAAIHHLRPADIERIEIVKGPRSALYGTEAIGGVVNIITRRPSAPFEASVTAGYGGYGTRSVAGSVAGRGEGFYGGIGVDHGRTSGFPPRRESDIVRGHDNRTLNAHLGHDGGTLRAELRHWQARGNSEYLDFFLTPLDQDFNNTATALEVAWPGGRSLSATLRLSETNDEIVQQQSPDFAATRRRAVDLQVDHDAGSAHLFSGGLLFTRERTDAEVFGSGFSERPATQALFGQYQYAVDDRRLLLAARHGRHDAYGGHSTWNAELGQRLTGDWRVTVGAGTAFRAPDSTQRFGFGGNPDLAPERARSIEAGIRGPIGEHSHFGLQVYQMHIADLVSFDVAANRLDNIDRARIRGAEVVWHGEFGRWRLRQSIGLADPVDRGTGEPLPRRARRSAQSSISFAASEVVDLSADLLATGSRRDSAFSTDTIGGYLLVNVAATWRIRRDWAVDLRVENLLDRDYETALGYPQAGRSAHLRIRWQHGVAD